MAMTDYFLPNAFKLRELTAAINHVPYVPARLRQLGWFQESGSSTVDIAVEEQNGVLAIVPVAPRGGPAAQTDKAPRILRSFRAPHLPVEAHIYADEVQGVRVFGSDGAAQVLETVRNERIATMRQNLEYTLEYHRALAVKGSFMDANGNIRSLFTEFGAVQQTVVIPLSPTVSSGIRGKMFTVAKDMRAGLGGTPRTGIRVLAGDAFWAALMSDKDVQATYLNQIQAAELRGDVRNSFDAFGATWEWYEGTTEVSLGDDAYAVPEGVPGLFITRYAPADYNETVNTIGLPFYSKAQPKDMDRGWDMEAQSNPLNIITRPGAVIKLSLT